MKILEVSGGTTTSTKQFIWCGASRCEERDGTGTVTKQFFALGQRDVTGTASYFYTKDHLGSVREMTDSSGAIKWQQSFDPYGQPATIVGTTPADFGYASMYQHSRSGLNLTMFRAYSPTLGRWLSRDPMGESAGTNLYGYVGNNPIGFRDPSGLAGESIFLWPLIALNPLAAAGLITVGGLAAGISDIPRAATAIGENWQILSGSQPGAGTFCQAKAGAATPQDIINKPDTTPEPKISKGKQYSRPGGMKGAVQDANSLGAENWKPFPTPGYGTGEGGLSADLPNGGTISIRPGNSVDPNVPTVQINNAPNAPNPTKFRYP